jgi:uncharacterized membrane protein
MIEAFDVSFSNSSFDPCPILHTTPPRPCASVPRLGLMNLLPGGLNPSIFCSQTLSLLVFPIPPAAFWPYFAGLAVLGLGLATVFRTELSASRGIDKALPFGRLFFAAPMAVFGAEHFTAAKDIGSAIPRWIPDHLFWAYFVGVALLAAAFSIAAKRFAGLAATLLGIMIFCFVLLIHIPRLMANPTDRISIAVVLRDLAFSASALALATTQAKEGWQPALQKVSSAARYVVGAALLFFAVQHFLHPGFVPVVPLGLAMPAWIPFHWVLSYVVGAALLVAGLAFVANLRARSAAIWLGMLVLAVVLLVYLPILVANPTDIGVAMNYFADTLLVSGALLVLGSSLPKMHESTG